MALALSSVDWNNLCWRQNFSRHSKVSTSCTCLWLKSCPDSSSPWQIFRSCGFSKLLASQSLRKPLMAGQLASCLALSLLERHSAAFSSSRLNIAALMNVAGTRGAVWNLDLWRTENTFINEYTEFSYLLPIGTVSEGLDSAFVGLTAHACPSLSAVIDFTFGSFSWHECGIFGVPNASQVPLEGGRARTSYNQQTTQWLKSLAFT